MSDTPRTDECYEVWGFSVPLYKLCLELERELAECEGLRKDAERYRWLRKHGNSFYNCIHYQGVDEVLDANVDAAIAAGKEGTK